MASQVAVTTSVVDRAPILRSTRWHVQCSGGCARRCAGAVVFYASTNKVYGGMEDVAVVEEATRYTIATCPAASLKARHSISTRLWLLQRCRRSVRPGLRAHLWTQDGCVSASCIYGTRQFGIEDQGWVAHFCIAAALGRPISIYGNGKQVRDVLWIEDLVRAYDLAIEKIDVAAGRVYNIGGGPANAMSVWAEFGSLLEELAGHSIPVEYADWRRRSARLHQRHRPGATRVGLDTSGRVARRHCATVALGERESGIVRELVVGDYGIIATVRAISPAVNSD